MGGYIGAKTGTLVASASDIRGDISATDTTPEITLKNTTETDADGNRSGKITFKGEQSGGEESVLAQIQGSHDGTADDEKGDLIFKTNDGSDGSSPTERLRIDSDGSISTATLGTSNVKLGLNAGKVIASGGNYNTLIGEDAGIAISTGDRNTAVGYQSLKTTSTGQYNTAIGYQALEANTGSGNTAVGDQALEANIGGANNTAVGDDAGVAVTTGSNNTFIGVAAGDGTDDGGNNTAVGKSALTSNCGDNNTAVGLEALRDTTGSVNTAIGKNSGNAITSGSKNTIIGSYGGNSGGLDIRTSSNNIVLSDGDGTPHGGYNGLVNASYPHWNFNSATNSYFATSVRHTGSAPYGLAVNFTGASPNNTSREFIFCNDPTASRFTVFADGSAYNATGTYAQYSDIKLKENIADASSQWDDIKAVRVRNFSMKSDNKDKANMIGVIAQELEASGMSGLVSDTFDKDADGLPTEETTKAVKQSILYMKAVKALQEAMARIETLESQNTTQATQIADLITRVTALEAE